ncbi:MAG: ferrichrome-iron receptor [Phenylobacterium sp.]|nr:ferrichrome-iron receptor [Phenylobacterium sp.]
MKLKPFLFGATLLTAPILPAAAHAQAAAQPKPTAAGPATNVEEVVVTGKFIATGAYSGTKLDIPVADTPLSVSAYTRSFMNAVEVTQIADLYKYMTGVQRAGNTGYDITLRGFKTSGNDRNAIMTDGMPGLTVRFGSPPTVGTDHVEVVKGPASVLYGQAQPGGFVNIITKKPSFSQNTEVEARFNTSLAGFDRQGGALISVDSTGPLLGDKLAYRFIAETGASKGFRDGSFEHPIYVAPSLTWEITEKDRATVLLEYRHTKTHYDTYLVAPHRDVSFAAPINTSYQEPGDFLKETGKTATLLYTHEFTNKLKFNLDYRYVDHSDNQANWDVTAVAPNFTQVTRRARQQLNKRTYAFVDASVVSEFDLGPFSNKMVAGVNFGRETADLNRIQFYNAPLTGPLSATVNVINPAHGLVLPLSAYPLVNPTTPANLNDRYSVNDASGAYVSDLITFTPQIKAMVGLRYSQEDLSIIDKKLANVAPQSGSNHDTLPIAGLLYEPNEHWSFYVTYSTSFVPVPASTQDVNGLYSFSPTTADSLEEGVKADLMDHRLTFTAANFDIKKKNVVNTFACPIGTCSEQLGAEESKGQEFEVNAQPLPNWQIAAGYSHLDATVTSTNIANQMGALLTNVPKNNAHMWTRYDIQEGMLGGLGVGLGVAYVGQRAGLLPTATSTDTMPLPAYTTVDMALYYKLHGINVTFKVTNLFDERYYESAGFTGDINLLPGEPRTATLTLRTSF